MSVDNDAGSAAEARPGSPVPGGDANFRRCQPSPAGPRKMPRMTSRSDPNGRAGNTSPTRRVYEAVCWATLLATVVAAGILIALLVATVLRGIWTG